ncbi:MAG: hypothetical protein J6B77_09475 [Clostridia bacterium]|nr:hypothetical protein [Clostridia bacterium]
MEDRSNDNASNQNDTLNENSKITEPGTAPESTPVPSGSENGFTVVSEEEYARMQEVQPPASLPKKEKKKRSVPLLAFIASLLAVVLVCSMFTVAIASSARYYGYLEGVKESLTPGGGETNGGNIFDGLFGDIFDSDEFDQLDFLNWFFENYSYHDLSDVDFLTAVLKAYVEASGDLYAEYYTQEEFDAMNAENAGEGVGIGVSVIYSPVTISGTEYTALEIITAFPGSPAIEAGVQPGDLVFYVGVGETRELVQSIGYTEALNRLRGEKGTVAEFTVLRPQSDGTYEEVEFRITRDEYTMQSVEYKVSETDPTVGIVRILQFDLTTPGQFKNAMDTLIGKGIEKFVFDVRNNPGGDLRSICAVLSYFLEEGDLIISAVDRKGAKEEQFAVATQYSGDYAGCSVKKEEIGKYRGYDMTVLTNGNTASAAELFTATMRDYELATTVGTTTYGKGSMQSIFSLASFGFGGAVKLTTKHYFPPCGEGYDGIGITPDVVVELSEEAAQTNIYKLAESDDAQLQAALNKLATP